MRRLAFLLLFVALVVPQVGGAAPVNATVGFAPARSKVIQVVGGQVDGEWVKSEKLRNVYSAQWQLFTLTGKGPELLGGSKQGDETGSVIVPLQKTVPVDALAVSSPLASQPRKGRVVKADPALRGQVAALLRSRGVKVDQPRIVQCVQVDLLGDGDPEWLIVAASRDNLAALGPKRSERDYELAAMAWISPRGPRRASILVVEPVHFEGARVKDDVAQDFRWVGVADVEGNGRMVAALRSTYYEGGGMDLVSFDGKRIKTLVSEGWGL